MDDYSLPPLPVNSFDGTVSVGQYLATRLVQLGAPYVFGLPGDFNLSLLDEMTTVDGLTWVGSTNELNAAYAADGYARVSRRMAAIVTTYGVGELSAINGIAGSFAEDVPVVQITGAPSTAARNNGALLHHTLADGDYDHFLRAYAEVTADSGLLKEATATRDIDRILMSALAESKPVYIAVPTDVATARVSAANLLSPLAAPISNASELARFESALRLAVAGETSVAVLAGPQVHRVGLEGAVRRIADVPGVYVASQSSSKAILDESHPASLGTYMGAYSQSEEARDMIDDAPLLVLAGAVMSDFLTGFFSHRFNPARAVELGLTQARIGEVSFYGVRLADSLAVLNEVLASELNATPTVPVAPAQERVSAAPREADEPLAHADLWRSVQAWLRPDTTVIAEAGTSFYGALDLRLPDRSDLLGQPVWSSIGYTLPATLGACLAAPDRRAVLFIGDGSAMLTIQELGTILHRGLTPVIFLVNNAGYTVERKIQSPAAAYQDIAPWNWTALPAALGAADRTVTFVVRTLRELREALAAASVVHDKAVFVEVVLDRDDAPPLLVELAGGIANANKSAGPAVPELEGAR